jgi:hypothetical protein
MALFALIGVAILLASLLLRPFGLSGSAEHRLLAALIALALCAPVVLAVGSVSLFAAQILVVVAALALLIQTSRAKPLAARRIRPAALALSSGPAPG